VDLDINMDIGSPFDAPKHRRGLTRPEWEDLADSWTSCVWPESSASARQDQQQRDSRSRRPQSPGQCEATSSVLPFWFSPAIHRPVLRNRLWRGEQVRETSVTQTVLQFRCGLPDCQGSSRRGVRARVVGADARRSQRVRGRPGRPERGRAPASPPLGGRRRGRSLGQRPGGHGGAPGRDGGHGRRCGGLARLTRGDIYRIRLPSARGREQAGRRYAVIVQADELLGLSTAIVAPTSRSAAATTFRPEIDLANERTRVLVEQLRAVDLDRLGKFAGRLTAGEQQAVDEALTLVLDL
jgi:mRNA interferase MazF